MSDFDVHVPCSLIEAPFPDWVKVVWMRIRGYQGRNEWASCFLKTVAADINKDPGNVSAAVQALEFFGWIERNGRRIRCVTGASKRREIRAKLPIVAPGKTVEKIVGIVCSTSGIVPRTTVNREDAIVPRTIIVVQGTTEIVQGTTEIVQGTIPTESQHLKPTFKANNKSEHGNSDESPPAPEKDGGSELDFPEDSWQRKYASRAIDLFEESGSLSNAIRRQLNGKGREYVIQQWADTLRLCHEQDGYSVQVLGEILAWLFEEDDFWVGRGLRSLGAIRHKKSGEAERKIDKIHGQWKAATHAETKQSRKRGSAQGSPNGQTPRRSARERANGLDAESIKRSTERSREMLKRFREGGTIRDGPDEDSR